jgi:hypothetical protein
MKYAIEMGSGAMTYIPSFIKIGSGIQKLIGGIHRRHGELISPLLFFQNKVNKIKIRKKYSEIYPGSFSCVQINNFKRGYPV